MKWNKSCLTPAIDWDCDRKGNLVRQLVFELGSEFYTSLNIISSQLKASSFFLQFPLYLLPFQDHIFCTIVLVFFERNQKTSPLERTLHFLELMIGQQCEILFSSCWFLKIAKWIGHFAKWAALVFSTFDRVAARVFRVRPAAWRGGAAAVPPRSSPPTCLLMVSTRVHLPGVGSKLVVIGVVAVVVLVSVVVRVERCVWGCVVVGGRWYSKWSWLVVVVVVPRRGPREVSHLTLQVSSDFWDGQGCLAKWSPGRQNIRVSPLLQVNILGNKFNWSAACFLQLSWDFGQDGWAGGGGEAQARDHQAHPGYHHHHRHHHHYHDHHHHFSGNFFLRNWIRRAPTKFNLPSTDSCFLKKRRD